MTVGDFKAASSSLCAQTAPFGRAVVVPVEASGLLVVVWIRSVIVCPLCGLLVALSVYLVAGATSKKIAQQIAQQIVLLGWIDVLAIGGVEPI